MLDRRALETRRFPADRLAALYAAVEVDDVVDPRTPMPERIALDVPAEQLIDCFRLSRQLYVETTDRRALVALLRTLLRTGDLPATDRRRYKDIRAKLKQLRFAFALYSARHRYPRLLNRITVTLGHLQDAFKMGRRLAVLRHALLCRLLLSRPAYRLVRREVDRLEPADAADFRAYVARQIATLRATLAQREVTGAQFHGMRKIVSRQVAFCDTLHAIAPDRELHRLGRVLAAINGLMGGLHDELVARRTAGTQDYHRDPFPLPADIRGRLAALVAGYDAAGIGVA